MKTFNLLLIMLLVLEWTAYATNGLFPIFMGSQSAGRAGTDMGVANDATCIATNPAGIAFQYGTNIDLTVGTFFPVSKYKDQWNDERSKIEVTPVAFFAMTWDAKKNTWEPFYDVKNETQEIIYLADDAPQKAKYHYDAYGQGNLYINGNDYRLSVQGHGATLSNFRLFSFMPAESLNKRLLFSQDKIQNLPLNAKVVSITARVQGQGTFTLQIEDIKSELINGYTSIIWNKPYDPAYIQLLSNIEDNTPSNIEISLGYRFQDETHWVQIENDEQDVQSGICYQFLDSNHDSISVEKEQIINIPFNNNSDSVKNIIYSYRLNTEERNSFVQVQLAYNKQSLESVSKQTVAVPSELAICHSVADHQYPNDARPSGWKFGFGIMPQTGCRYSLDIESDLYPEGVENRTDITFLSLVPSVAYRFNDRFSIGASLNVNFEMLEFDGVNCQDSSFLRGNIFPNNSNWAGLTYGDFLKGPCNVQNIKGQIDSDTLYGFGFGGKIGLLWKVTDTFQIGASYTFPTWMADAEGSMKVDYNRHFNSIPLAHIANLFLPNQGRYGYAGKYDVEVEFTLPQQVGAGFSWLLFNQLLLSMDCRWINYSDTQSEMKIRVSHGTNADLNAMLGPSKTTVLNMGWDDQIIVSLGLSWQATSSWIFRCGYNYGTNPVPSKYSNPQFISIMEHHITAGASYLINRNVSVHAAVEVSLPYKLNSKENLVHEDFSNSSLEVYNIGALLGVSVRF